MLYPCKVGSNLLMGSAPKTNMFPSSSVGGGGGGGGHVYISDSILHFNA